DEELGVRAYGDLREQRVIHRARIAARLAISTPGAEDRVAADADDAAVAGELHAQHAAGDDAVLALRRLARVGLRDGREREAVADVPDDQVAVLAGGGEKLAIAAPTQAGDGVLVVGEHADRAAGVRFPQEDATAAVAGGEARAIGGELEGGDPVGVFLDFVEYFSF